MGHRKGIPKARYIFTYQGIAKPSIRKMGDEKANPRHCENFEEPHISPQVFYREDDQEGTRGNAGDQV